jgi:MFS family permease
MAGLLDPKRIVAPPGYNRWWTIPAALLINLSIGQAYAFSVFNLPLTRVIGISESAAGDWRLTTIGWIFTLAYVLLGLSAGLTGRWLERVGPRTSGIVATLCWSGGFYLAALGVHLHQIALLYLGYGVLGGCGLGIGFNTPIATLIRWFPDRRGMATGMAIMGFGGGAIVAAPLSEWLMGRFASESSVGVAETFLVLGTTYLVAMGAASFLFRVPPSGWAPPPGSRAEGERGEVESAPDVTLEEAMGARQFYLLWMVIALNVTAGIGVLGQAAAMIQEIFRGFSGAAAAGFVALLSVFNMLGRFLWAFLSDQIGRKTVYGIFFGLGPILYALVPVSGHWGSLPLFVGCFAILLTMYGGGFACLPAYVSDVFGTRHVGALHGRLLTALSVAGVLGPFVVNYVREYNVARGVPKAEAYDFSMYIMAAVLVMGFFCNLAIRPFRGSGVAAVGRSSAGELATDGER